MGLAHDELLAKGPEQVELLLAWTEVERETGPYGQLLSESTSDAADPENYEHPNPIRYIPSHFVDHAEAAVERYRKENDLPPGAIIVLERREYPPASPGSP